MIRLNSKLIMNPKRALEELMGVTAALYTGMNRNTPKEDAAEVSGICAAMWKVCDELRELAGGVEQ